MFAIKYAINPFVSF